MLDCDDTSLWLTLNYIRMLELLSHFLLAMRKAIGDHGGGLFKITLQFNYFFCCTSVCVFVKIGAYMTALCHMCMNKFLIM